MIALRVSVRASLVTTEGRRAGSDSGSMCYAVQILVFASCDSVLHSLLNVCLHIRGKASFARLHSLMKLLRLCT